MKAQWFTSRARYDFGKLLQESDYGRRYDETFHTWLTLTSCTLQQANCAAAGICSVAVEQEYMKEVKRVKNPGKLAEATDVLVDSLTEEPEDFLGQFVSELGMNDKSFRGQFFTPTDVCYCMARMVMHDLGQPKAETLQLAEPAVGCGAEQGPRNKPLRPMSLHWARELRDQCKAEGVPFFMKQLQVGDKITDDIELFPEDLQIREVPQSAKRD